MSEAKHTPGPWAFDSISMENGDYGVSQRDLRISICHVHNAASFGDFIAGAMKRGGGKFHQQDAHTQVANASPIAAAPEMLAALKWATKQIEILSEYIETPEAMKRFNECVAAIAKAEGRRSPVANSPSNAEGVVP